jgi:hypothetical protein
MTSYFEHNARQPELAVVEGDPAAELVPCTFCCGTGWVRSPCDPQLDRECVACDSEGWIHPARLERVEFEAQEAAAALDPADRGDWEYHQRLER